MFRSGSSRAWPVLVLVLAAGAAAAQQPTLRTRVIAAEDARVATPAGIAPLLQAVRGADAALAAQAARGLGRFERPAFVTHLLSLLPHGRPDVRREAANALGQSLASVPRAGDTPPPPELATVTRALLPRLRSERDPYVIGTIAETLGRLPHRTAASVREMEQALRAASANPHPGALLGIAKGLDSLVRFHHKTTPLESATLDRLAALATMPADPADADFAAIRRVAWMGVNSAGTADAALVERGLDDPDAQVRRLALAALGAVAASDDQRRRLLAAAFEDQSFNVRVEAVRAYGRTLQARDCEPLIAAARDANPHVALAAIDALGAGCRGGPNPTPTLAAFVDALPAAATAEWHHSAHALVSLARVNREEATRRLPRLAEHPVWQARMYAARAATTLAAAARLERLAADANDNVRHEALLGLRQHRRLEAAEIYVGALDRADYQLVLAAAQALEGTSAGEQAVPALLKAFARITAERRETSRDTRMAILARLRELGSREQAPSLQPCLSDFDPAVAAECAAVLRAWTGVLQTPRPVAVKPAPVAAALPARARVTMKGRGAFELRLLGDEAPASVSRFAALARRGYYNGLTFHRVLPNFIIQGGSPGANEYAGDGPFMRDELGLLSNVRGTVGVSTRGRDTGDAQIFVNLLDNPRLDHDFTVFADVASGMDVVDRILEGDVIERVDLVDVRR